MTASEQDHRRRSPRRRRPSGLALGAAVAGLALAASFAAVALASSSGDTVAATSNATLREQVVVTAQGLTLYTLSGESTSHLKCKSKECLKAWPPLTVASRKTKLKAGPGVQGHLGILRRSNGMLQVTVRGKPVYRFFGDHAKGQANGQGIESFGGRWSALPASAQLSSEPPVVTPVEEPKPAPQPSPYPEPYAQAPTTPAPAPATPATPTTPTTTTTSPYPY